MKPAIRLGIYEKALVWTGDWAALFEQVREAGFGFVDLSVDETPERAARLDWTAEECTKVRVAALTSGIQIGGICLSVHRAVMPGSADPAMRERAAEVYRKGINLAARLGVSVVQVAGYYAYYEPDDPAARQRYIDNLLAAVPHAARMGVILAIENVDGHDIASVPDVMELVRLAGSPWVQCYPDVGNIAGHGGDPATELRAGAGHIVAVHVKDVLPGEPRRIPFGRGIVDFDAAFDELARQRWSGRIMLEMWNDNASDSIEKCRVGREFITAKLAAAGLRLT